MALGNSRQGRLRRDYIQELRKRPLASGRKFLKSKVFLISVLPFYFIMSDEGTQGMPIFRISKMLAFATSSVAAEQQSVTTVVS